MRWCRAGTEQGADWGNATAGEIVEAECQEAYGFRGTAQRECTKAGVWGGFIKNCTRIAPNCPEVNVYNFRTNWRATEAGTVATGTCVLGFVESPEGPPQRLCTENGTWDNRIMNDCVVST